jgi:predicted RNA-binding protein Jag
MTDKVEIQGKTVDEAVSEALLRMGARRDEVDVTVLEEPKSGLFGIIGGRPARVIVRRRAGGGPRGPSGDYRVDNNDHPAHELGSGDGQGGRRGSRGSRGGRGRGRKNDDEKRDGRGEGRDENRSEGRRNNRGERRSEGRDERRSEGRGEGGGRGRGRRGDSERRAEGERQPREETRAAAGSAADGQDSDEKRTRRRRGRRGGRGRGGSGREQQGRMPANTAGEHIEDDLMRSIADDQAQFHAELQAQESDVATEDRAADSGRDRAESGEGDSRRSGRSRGRRGGRGRGGRGRGRGEGGEGGENAENVENAANVENVENVAVSAEGPDSNETADAAQPRNERRPAAETANGPTEPILPAETEAAVPGRQPAAAVADEPIATGIKAVNYAQPKRPLEEEALDAGLAELTSGMLVRAGFPCRCEVRPGEYRMVKIVTDDISAGMLIGRHGQTIDAVEHLVERMASTAAGDRVRMNLDINNYRRRREDSLADRVDQAVAEVRNTGGEVHLEPMDARERRVVHLQAEALGMRTWTVGGQGGKHVVIAMDDGSPRDEDIDPVEVEVDEAAEAVMDAAPAGDEAPVEEAAADVAEGEEPERPGADA